jgi:charged multivesicular body protein 7
MLLKHIDTLSTSSTVSNIHTLASIRSTLPVALSDNDISLLLTYLTRDKPRLRHLALPDGTTIVKIGISPITETDTTIATLKNLHTHLTAQLPALEKSIAQLDAQARTAVAAKNTATARAALKRKKLVTDALERRHEQAFSIQQTLDKIDQAADNVAMVRAMDASAKVLRRLNAEIGGVEGAEKVTDALAEQMGAVDEVTSVLNEPGIGQVIDETEVDEEFEALMKQEEEKAEKIKAEKEAADTSKKMRELEEFERQQQRERIDKERRDGQQVSTAPQSPQQHQEDVEVEETTQEIAEMSL